MNNVRFFVVVIVSMRAFLLVNIIVLISLSSFAQRRSKEENPFPDAELILRNELSFGVRLHSNGWGIYGEKVKFKTDRLKRVIQFEFQSFRNFRESKQPAQNDGFSSRKDYFYGKQSSFFALHASYGFRNRIADKTEKAGVRVSIIYLGGISLGLNKPYYLYLWSPDANPPDDPIAVLERYSESNEDRFLDKSQILGSAGFRFGLKEIDPIPGGHGKLGLNFDWASNDQFVKVLEVGLSADVYYKRVPILVVDNNKPYFLSVYLSLHFGKRW